MTLSIRVTEKEARTLETLSKRTGRSKSEIVREAIRNVRKDKADIRRETLLAATGSLSGPRDLSSREGFGAR
jgi:predicted transcriptional regulator